MPASEFALSGFAASLTQVLKPDTIRAHLSTICTLHMELGYADPTLDAPLLTLAMCGIRRETRINKGADKAVDHHASSVQADPGLIQEQAPFSM